MRDQIKIGDLFVELGVQGDAKLVKAMDHVSGTIGSIKTTTLATIGAITGLLYSLEQLTKSSLTTGNSLANFETRTGFSADTVQRYAYAAAGMVQGNEEVAGSFERIQQVMTELKHGNNPGFSEQFTNAMGGIDDQHMNPNSEEDAKMLIAKMQRAAKVLGPAEFNKGISALGISPGFANAIESGVFTQKNLSKAPVVSQSGIKALQNMYVRIQQIRKQIEIMFAGFVAKHGPRILSGLVPIIAQVERLANALANLADRTDAFGKLAYVFKSIADVLDFDLDKKAFMSKMKDLKDQAAHGDFDFGTKLIDKLNDLNDNAGQAIMKKFHSTPKSQPHASNNIDHKSTINIHTTTQDPAGLANLSGKAVQDAFYQSASLLAVV